MTGQWSLFYYTIYKSIDIPVIAVRVLKLLTSTYNNRSISQIPFVLILYNNTLGRYDTYVDTPHSALGPAVFFQGFRLTESGSEALRLACNYVLTSTVGNYNPEFLSSDRRRLSLKASMLRLICSKRQHASNIKAHSCTGVERGLGPS